MPKNDKRRQRVNDPEGVKRDIVEVATSEFARKGYGGARVDAIAARTRTSKRMIYYYFGGKEQLYLAVLERQPMPASAPLRPRSTSSSCGPRRRSAR